MSFDRKDIIIAFLLVVILIVIVGRRISFANTVSSPATAQGLPSGAILPKTAEEACQTKYGDGWIDFSPMLCKKM